MAQIPLAGAHRGEISLQNSELTIGVDPEVSRGLEQETVLAWGSSPTVFTLTWMFSQLNPSPKHITPVPASPALSLSAGLIPNPQPRARVCV